MKAALVWAALVCVLGGTQARAAETPPALESSARPRALEDREVRARLAYLEEHLEARRRYANLWWRGWTGFYALGVVVQSTRAGLTDDASERADLIVSAVKATGGVIKLLYLPLQAKDGASAIEAMPAATPEQRLQRLARAEEQLRANAAEADRRYSWVYHLLNVGVNVGGALIVWQGFDDPARAWRSAGIGIAVGEVMIWSQPWWPSGDWEEYQRRFGDVASGRVSWRIVPTAGGVALRGTF